MIYSHDKTTNSLKIILPKEIHGRKKIRRDLSLLRINNQSETRFHINSEQSLPVKLIKIEFHRVEFISRAACDELLCQIERLSCDAVCENLKEDHRQMLLVVLKKHPNLNINLI